jgi:hypothetical protein
MIIESYREHDAIASRRGRTLVCTADAIWFWPGISVTERRGSQIVAIDREIPSAIVTKLHGPAAVHSGMLPAIERAAKWLSQGDVASADRTLMRHSMHITPDGISLMRKVSDYLGIEPQSFDTCETPKLWSVADTDTFARMHLARVSDRRDIRALFGTLLLAKAGFRPDENRDARGQWTRDRATALLSTDIAMEPEDLGARSNTASRQRAPFLTVAAEEEESRGEEGLLGEFLDPTAPLRLELFEERREEIKRLNPGNAWVEGINSPNWVPNWRDVNDIGEALRLEKEEQLTRSPIWRQAWKIRGILAEKLRYPDRGGLHPNYPVIDRFTEEGIAVSVKSSDLTAPFYAKPGEIFSVLSGYVRDLKNFDGDKSLTQKVISERGV